MPRPRPNGNEKLTGWFVGAAYMPPAAAIPANQPNGQTARDAFMRPLQTCRKWAFYHNRQIPRRGGVTPPVSHCIKSVRMADTPNLLFLIYYFSTALMQSNRSTPPKQPPLPAETRQTGANQTYFTSSFGSTMFSKIATMAAGTMPEPPNTRRTASGVWARIPVLAPMP